jgi:hypothetical protein
VLILAGLAAHEYVHCDFKLAVWTDAIIDSIYDSSFVLGASAVRHAVHVQSPASYSLARHT